MALSTIGTNQIASEAVTVPKVTDQVLSSRNLIINGAMQVAQRGTSASASNGSYVSLDRYITNVSGGGAYTFSQETDTPSGQGFKNSMKVNVDTADSSIASGDYYVIQYRIEGQNVAHLMLGTSDAVKVTLSFWVKSSLTGNFGASFINSAANRSYPFQYNISSANTWQKITKTVQLDTSGTWLTDNGIGLKVLFDFGSGTTYQGTADAWGSANYHTASSSVQLIGTASATWYLTGLQLEVGSTATPFEHRSYGDELARCQRYYYKTDMSGAGTSWHPNSLASGTGYLIAPVHYPVAMRASPTGTTTATSSFTFSGSAPYFSIATTTFAAARYDVTATTGGYASIMSFSLDAEL